jgi:hypothetical protein
MSKTNYREKKLMKYLKIFTIPIVILLVVFVASGCNWQRAKTDSASDEESAPAVAVDSVESSPVSLTNLRELEVSSDGLMATGYDGQLSWSPDGTLVAIGMSNQTLASTQTQLLEVATGRRVAVIGGYNVHWDENNSDRLIFVRHQYYGPPDYGSFEETVAISQTDLLRAEVFNEDMSYEVISAGEIETGDMPADILQTAAWRNSEIQIRFENGQTNLYFVGTDQKAVALLDPDKNYNAFALDPSEKRILIREVAGAADEFGNLDANDNNTRFLLADIIENN